MAVSFVIGRAGSGKTHRCLVSILAMSSSGKAVLLVPEQATFQMERALFLGSQPAYGASVLSFRRLAWRVLSETGSPAEQPLDEIGKRMVLRAITQRCGSRLSIFARTAARPGFIESMAGSVKELRAYEVTPERLSLLAREHSADRFLSSKLADLSLVYEEYSRFLETAFTDPDKYLTLAAQRIERSALCAGAHVWVDGFNGFTPQEVSVLLALARTASSLTLTLTLDPVESAHPVPDSLFAPTSRTYELLRERLAAEGIPIDHTLILPGDGRLPRFDSAELNHLEREFGAPVPRPWQQKTASISYWVCPSKASEVAFVANEITSLARDKGYRWNDIAVLTNELGAYRNDIESCFARLGIPVFIDARKPVTFHPLIEAVRAIVDILTDDWSGNAAVRLLKTDLIPCSRDDIDQLENYVLGRGITGSMWRRPETWGDETASRTAFMALKPVLRAEQELPHPWKLDGLIAAIESVLAELKVEEVLARWARDARLANDNEQASVHEQVFDGVTSVLEQARAVLGDDQVSPRDARHILETGLSTISLGMVPPSIDQVVVGSLDRSRHPKVRAAFVLGLIEGGFPGRVSEDPVLSDSERERLLACGLEMAPSGVTRALDQDFMAYVALTRASERLYISRPLADGMGKAFAESRLLGRIRRIFPGLTECRWPAPSSSEADELRFLAGRDSALRLIASAQGGNGGRVRRAATQWIKRNSDSGALRFLDLAARKNAEPSLGVDTSVRLYGGCLEISVSRLESFASCPFQHFAAYGLRLLERQLGRLDPSIAGSYLHSAMSHLISSSKLSGVDLGSMTDEQLEHAAAAAALAAEQELSETLMLDSPQARTEILELREAVRGAAATLAVHQCRGEFRPVAAEVSFGPGRLLDVPEEVTHSGVRVQLKGRVDLVEMARHQDKVYFRVIDYKSRPHQLSQQDIHDGVDLQLAGYMMVLQERGRTLLGGDPEPAAMLYFPLKEPFTRQDSPPDSSQVDTLRLQRRRMSGIVTSDPEALRLMDRSIDRKSDLIPVSLNTDGRPRKSGSVASPGELRELSQRFTQVYHEATQRIAAGDVRIFPYKRRGGSACQTCAFSAVCGFDPTRPENRYRFPRPVALASGGSGTP